VTGAPLAVFVSLIVPQPGAQATPFCVKVQATPLLVASFVTVAENCCVAFNATLADVGNTETEIGKIVILARLDAPLLVTEIAWRCTPRNPVQLKRLHPTPSGVKCAGAVKVVGAPLAVLVGETVPHHVLQDL
jgi:hypothetical protein